MDFINSHLIPSSLVLILDTLAPSARPLLYTITTSDTIYLSTDVDRNHVFHCCKKLGTPMPRFLNLQDDLQGLLDKLTQMKPDRIIVDTISTLLYSGMSLIELLDWIEKLKQLNSSIILLLHSDLIEDDYQQQQLVNSLIHQSTMILSLQPLPTGHSKDLHGQLIVNLGPRNTTSSHGYPMLRHVILSDTVIQLLAPGTSHGTI